MNIFTNNLKANFVSLLPNMCAPPTQKMQFHHNSASSQLQSLIGNNMELQNSARCFKNPNYFDQSVHDNSIRRYKINHFDVKSQQNGGVKPEQNPCSDMVTETVLESTDFGKEVLRKQSRKRSRRGRNKRKNPEKHNCNRQIINEMMDLETNCDSVDVTLDTIDENVDENEHGLKLCDLLVLPKCSSSPLPIAITPKSTCFAFSISPPGCVRTRQISSTESEDSFIVFDSGTDEECEFSENRDSDNESDDSESDIDSPNSIVPTKKVRFADGKELCEIHPMVQWSFAYQAARKGPWEVYARDRERFKNRIKMISRNIEHCFQPEHRRRIYEERFRNEL